MSATTITETPAVAPDSPEQPGPVPTIATTTRFAHIDPRTVFIAPNVRDQVRLNARFIESIRQNGVLQPVLLHEQPDGELHVRAGKRRTLGAIAADQPTYPAYIFTGDGDEVRRVIEQMAENDDREGLTAAERAGGFQTLALLGVPAGQIAKRTGHTKAAVEAGITVAASANATQALTTYELTLEDAALFAEFEDDEQATQTLTRTASNRGSLRHTAERIRAQRVEAAKVAKITATLKAAKVKIRSAPGYYDTTVRAVSELRAKGSKEALTAETHATCPGHAVYINTDGEPTAVVVCNDYKANGHLRYTEPTTPAAPKPALSEEDRQARRDVIANNKAWPSAETVRREWLAKFATRRTAPKGTSKFIAHALHAEAHAIQEAAVTGHAYAAELLGHKGKTRPSAFITDAINKATPGRADVIMLVIVLAAIEKNTTRDAWRNSWAAHSAYFAAIETWGYTLSEVETLARKLNK